MKNEQLKATIKKIIKSNSILWHFYNFFHNIYYKYFYIPTLFKKFNNIPKLELCVMGSQEPSLAHPVSQLATVAQCLEQEYAYWCAEMRSPKRINRKQWEFVYILAALKNFNCIKKGMKGLGFGCGQEQLPAVFVKHGCDIVATDQDVEHALEQGWVKTSQHANELEGLNYKGIVSHTLFKEHVQFRNIDMNSIPDNLIGFDFLWSSCAFEHLGSIEHGLKFVQDAMKCLKPGGIAVHTTEFNLSSNTDTFESPTLSIFRKQDMEKLVTQLTKLGHNVTPFNWHSGSLCIDNYIDLPPYNSYLKLDLFSYTCTSIGIVIRKSLAN